MIFVICISLMVLDHYTHLLLNFRTLLLTTVEPIEKAASLPLQAYRYFQQDFQSLESLRQKNQQLATENLLLKAKQQQLTRLQLEVKRLNQLVGTASQLPSNDVRIANISFYNQSPYAQFFTLDKGRMDGIRPQQAVIDAKGLVGLITTVTPTSSRVQLITDSDSQIPVRIQRTGQRGILTGLGQTQLSLQFIPNTSSIVVGDLIETSGLGGVYPKGYPVGTVASVQQQQDQPYFEILADPIARINELEKVLILSQPAPTGIDIKLETDIAPEVELLGDPDHGE